MQCAATMLCRTSYMCTCAAQLLQEEVWYLYMVYGMCVEEVVSQQGLSEVKPKLPHP